VRSARASPIRRGRERAPAGVADHLAGVPFAVQEADIEIVLKAADRLAFDDVRFVKVPGHAGVVENERCDVLARAAITSRR
jgi:hypothetical protein